MRIRNAEGVNKARSLRRRMTVSERVLWQVLRNRRLIHKFRRQVPVGNYILDFYCDQLKLCIEVDGPQHEFTQRSDAARDPYLRDLGIKTFRIRSLHLFEPKDLIGQIHSVCQHRSDEIAAGSIVDGD